jgi:hypothetical protein
MKRHLIAKSTAGKPFVNRETGTLVEAHFTRGIVETPLPTTGKSKAVDRIPSGPGEMQNLRG